MTSAPFVAFGFANTHTALAAEAVLRDLGIEVTPMPTPRSLGELCGIALRVPEKEAPRAEGLLRRADIDVSAQVAFDDRV